MSSLPSRTPPHAMIKHYGGSLPAPVGTPSVGCIEGAYIVYMMLFMLFVYCFYFAGTMCCCFVNTAVSPMSAFNFFSIFGTEGGRARNKFSFSNSAYVVQPIRPPGTMDFTLTRKPKCQIAMAFFKMRTNRPLTAVGFTLTTEPK